MSLGAGTPEKPQEYKTGKKISVIDAFGVSLLIPGIRSLVKQKNISPKEAAEELKQGADAVAMTSEKRIEYNKALDIAAENVEFEQGKTRTKINIEFEQRQNTN